MNPRPSARGDAAPSPAHRPPLPAPSDACAHCGVVLMKAASEICRHCHFVYCQGHQDREEHRCVEVCLDCPPNWGA